MKLNLVKRLAIGSFAGGILGYLIIHPFFMFMEHYLIHHSYTALQSILMSFSKEHFGTAVILIILGLIVGFLQGLYNHRANHFFEKARLLSITDELTQMNNRRYFISELEKEIERSKRFSRNLSLIILDIDKFKYYNDTYGHIFGDKVIQVVARFLTETTRKTDFVARYGGDEFVIVMPDKEKSMANVFIERLQKKFSQDYSENHELPKKIEICLSIGIASFPNDAKNVDELIHNADLALYKAKEKGGNNICNFDKELRKNSNSMLDIKK